MQTRSPRLLNALCTIYVDAFPAHIFALFFLITLYKSGLAVDSEQAHQLVWQGGLQMPASEFLGR